MYSVAHIDLLICRTSFARARTRSFILHIYEKEKKRMIREGQQRTRRQTLLQLIRLIQILEHERIQESMTSHFKLDLLGFAISFDPRRCPSALAYRSFSLVGLLLRSEKLKRDGRRGLIQVASFRLQISRNCLMSETSLGIVAGRGGKRESLIGGEDGSISWF